MSVVGAVGTGLNLIGNFMGARAKNRMVAEQTRASKRAENAREQQMRLESAHRRRQSVREALVARSMALSVGTAQGAAHGSGVASATGQALAQGAENQQVASATEQIGGRVFDANRDYFEATQRGSQRMSFAQGISSIGGALVNNAGMFNKVGTYFGNRPSGSTLNRNI